MRFGFLWKYLTQPLFSPEFKTLNPVRFWQLHRLEKLETTWLRSQLSEAPWQIASIEYLEGCWLQDLDRQAEFCQDLQIIQRLENCWRKSEDSLRESDESEGRY